MSSEELDEGKRQFISEFKFITGLESEDDKILKLLTVNDFNLNNSISNYFDNGFESIGTNQASSAVEVLDSENNEAELRHRSSVHTEHDLQRDLFLNMYLPKLPKAPRITNQWQLDVGIYSSSREVRSPSEKSDEMDITEKERRSTSPINSLWLILLLIPKSFLQVVISLWKFFFGSSDYSSNLNRFPNSFNFEHYDSQFKFLQDMTKESKIPANETLIDGMDSGTDSSNADFKKEISEGDFTEVLDDYKIDESDFNELHRRAQEDYSWLIVVLTSNDQNSINFLKKLLNNQNFNKLFNKKSGVFKENMIFAQNVDKSPEGFELGQTYHAKRLPFLMLIGNISNSPSVLSSMSIAYKTNLAPSFISAEEVDSTIRKILKNMNRSLETFNPQLISQRFDQQEIKFSRMIKQQQDDAYSQSLEKDRLKKIQKENERRIQQEIAELSKLKENSLYKLISDSWTETLQSDESKTKIAIKLPNGKRAIAVFDETITVSQLYLYVELKLFINDLIAEGEFSNEDEVLSGVKSVKSNIYQPFVSAEEYSSKFSYMFELIQPFPKKNINISDEQIGKVAELKSGANLLVELNEVEDEAYDSE